ncbi:hypothetical protein VP01_4g9 [Puccinia sorghi]|uniref:hAT-like transposase RNase-H fold domain-containing protein n=1 Tax=Puccinia sorghi TaxID=27349 RepID=A0A0L6ULP9_9BASI|nr:hypothetical protein VP01_4g9 [Puccinia sorghi]
MIQHAINLHPSCEHFCSESQELTKYHLSPAEWGQAANLMHLLEPLSKVTEILCGSKYPTLNKALPVYLALMNQLKQVQCGLYNQSLLIQPATLVFHKIEHYLIDSLKKPAYLCTMILDPTCKTIFWKNYKAFILEYYHLSEEDILNVS